MNKLGQVLLFVCLVILVGFGIIFNMNSSYATGLTMSITGKAPNRVLHFYDADSGGEVMNDDAVKYYGVYDHFSTYSGSEEVYFYKCKEITKSEYEIGFDSDDADKRTRDRGDIAYRVHNTEEVKKALDDLYSNLRYGYFYLEMSKYEYKNSIDWNEVRNYYNSKYGLPDVNINYYNYAVKGEWEPNRSGLNYYNAEATGELEISTTNIRISNNEYTVLNNFVNNLIPLLQGDGSDYQKVLGVYTYITKVTSYLVDNGFVDDMLASNTSAYDALINRQSVCIGYSIAFTYLMDKMGIESYIVDSLTYDGNGELNGSSHTYNVVKLDGQFYTIDLTGNVFLTSASGKLTGGSLPLATSSYNTSGKITSISLDYTKINNYLNQAKSVKTTTTGTTTKQVTTSWKAPTTKKGETTAANEEEVNTTREFTTSQITNEVGEVIEVITEEASTGEITSDKKTTTSTKTNVDSKKKFSFSIKDPVNIVLMVSIVIIIGAYIGLKVYKKKQDLRNKATVAYLESINKPDDELK